MSPGKKRFTEDFIAKWSKASVSEQSKTDKILLRRQEGLLKKNPGNARLWFAHGKTLQSMGKYKAALTSFKKAESIDPNLQGLALTVATVQRKLGELSGASKRYMNILIAECKRIKHPYFKRLSQAQQIKEILSEMSEEEMSNPERMRKIQTVSLLTAIPFIGQLKARVLFEAGFRNLEDLKDASMMELASIKGIGKHTAEKIKSIVSEDKKDSKKELIDEIEDDLNEFICPLCGTILSASEKICYECGMKFGDRLQPSSEKDLEEALKEYEEVLRDNPDNTKLWYAKGETLARLKRYEEAIDAFNQVTKLDPKYPGVWNIKAEVFTNIGDHQKAATSYKRAMELGVRTAMTAAEDKMDDLLKEIEKVGEESEIDKEIWMDQQQEIKNELRELRTEHKGLPTRKVDLIDEEKEILDSITKGLDNIVMEKDEELDLLQLDEEDEILIEDITKPLSSESVSKPTAVLEPTEEESKKIETITKPLSSESVSKPTAVLEPTEEESKRIETITKPLTMPAAKKHERGMTNGLAGKDKGFVNGTGRTNGLTNGLGRTNGMTNGLTNGLGRTNGMTNGLTNGLGRTNGMTNGLTNGLGRTNGMTNGLTNGVTNGLTNGLQTLKGGLTNGLTNGTGITNGLGSLRFSREARVFKWKLYVIPVVMLLLIMIPLLTPVTPHVETYPIIIDGDFADWSNLQTIESAEMTGAFNSDVDIKSCAVENNGDRYLSFRVEVFGEDRGILSGEDVTTQGSVDLFHIFIDTDLESETGYRIRDIGAENMIKIQGWKNQVLSASLFSFSETADPDNWNGFGSSGTTKASASGNTLETQIEWSAIGFNEPRPIFATVHAQSWDGYHDLSDSTISNTQAVISTVQRSLATELLSGPAQRLLTIDVTPHKYDATLTGISVSVLGTLQPSELPSLRLMEGTTTVSTVTQATRTVNFNLPNVQITAGQTSTFVVETDIPAIATPGRTLGVRIPSAKGITVTNGTSCLKTESTAHDLGYLGIVPAGVVIDGAFSDWSGSNQDQSGEASVGTSHSIDIRGYGARNIGTSIQFYLSTAGNLMGGAEVPCEGLTAPFGETQPDNMKDSDGDGTPDIDEIGTEHDFDNDNVADTLDDDKDNDGIRDYDHGGTDEWLTNDNGASRYIGPPEPTPPVMGYDTIRIFVDTDENPSSGFIIRGIGADQLIEFIGKYGIVKEASVKSFTGAHGYEWSWAEAGTPTYSHDTIQLEAAINMATASNISVWFETNAWNGNEDASDDITQAAVITFSVRSGGGGDESFGPTYPITVWGRATNETEGAPDGTWVTIAVYNGAVLQGYYNTTTITIGGVQGRFIRTGIYADAGWTIEVNVSWTDGTDYYNGTNSTNVQEYKYGYHIDVYCPKSIIVPEFNPKLLIFIIPLFTIIRRFRRIQKKFGGKKNG